MNIYVHVPGLQREFTKAKIYFLILKLRIKFGQLLKDDSLSYLLVAEQIHSVKRMATHGKGGNCQKMFMSSISVWGLLQKGSRFYPFKEGSFYKGLSVQKCK